MWLASAYTYAGASITALIESKLAETIAGLDAMDPQAAWRAMQRAVRNLGREGLAATAISAVDSALYDLKARILECPWQRCSAPIATPSRFTAAAGSPPIPMTSSKSQLGGWVSRDGCAFVKMKVGTDPDDDPRRVAVAKAAIGEATLFVDANGAYTVKQALALAARFADQKVGWFEEPVSSDDLRGLREIRERAPVGMDIAAGEYAYTISYVRAMLEAEAVDVQQADVTRCGGVTAFLQIGALCEAFQVDLSGHCAPALHLHVVCAVPRLRHLEWFHDHARIEHMLFEGAPTPEGGVIRPDFSRPGNGLAFKSSGRRALRCLGDRDAVTAARHFDP